MKILFDPARFRVIKSYIGHVSGIVRVATSLRIVDGVQMGLGFLLGGPLGIGTVIFLVAMAPMIKVGLRWLRYSPPVGVDV